jgi:putative ABC transport system ATP-binding protein
MVRLRDVSKSFEEGGHPRPVLANLDLRAETGQILALLGRSGSGKSTLLNLISGMDLPDLGEVVVNGTPVHALDERSRTLFRRREVGFVFQFFNLIPTLTVLENLLLPMELNLRTDTERAHALLSRVGLADRAGSFPDRLSGGEQQRIAIARSLAHDPPLLLADEPTGNLDADTGEQIVDLLFGAVREHGKTLLMVTHSHELARRADRALTLRDGALVDAFS